VNVEDIVFLDVDEVIELHASQLELFGGGAGLRDQGLLESAVAQPQASFGGHLAHDGLFAMAAAYLSTSSATTPLSTATSASGSSRRSSFSTSTACPSPTRVKRFTS
jgi:death-on-curing protein